MTRRRMVGLSCGLNLGLLILAIFLASVFPPNVIDVLISWQYGTALMVLWVGMFWGLWRNGKS